MKVWPARLSEECNQISLHSNNDNSIGLGPVISLKASLSVDEIVISWSPPMATGNLSLNYTVAYTSSANGSPLTTTTTTSHQSWSIRASLGDMYSVMVTPNTNSGPGETLAITVGLDCEFRDLYCRTSDSGHSE